MNLAFPALFLFLVILPGFVFCQFFQPSEVRTVDHAPFSAMVLKALLCAALLNAMAATAVHVAGYEIRLGDIIRLLVGGASSLKDLDDWLIWLNRHPVTAVGYFALTNGLALASALFWRRAVERWKLSRKDNLFAPLARGDAPWHYLFSGIDHQTKDTIDGVAVAAVVEFQEASYLYAGMLNGYEVDENGRLDRLLLIRAKRRKLEHDRECYVATESYLDKKERFYTIRGDVFVLRFEETKTLNITYLSIAQKKPAQCDALVQCRI